MNLPVCIEYSSFYQYRRQSHTQHGLFWPTPSGCSDPRGGHSSIAKPQNFPRGSLSPENVDLSNKCLHSLVYWHAIYSPHRTRPGFSQHNPYLTCSQRSRSQPCFVQHEDNLQSQQCHDSCHGFLDIGQPIWKQKKNSRCIRTYSQLCN